ncbi:hypothetical protein ACIOUE_37780 [Streptomyces xanthochromogenes]|uniref:hypothetical protein n=1 Tax=Streptomyces xanthochromogenes TaxID=67384 RepID=UPI00380981ED
MTCSECDGRPCVAVQSFPAGDTRSSLAASHAAQLDRQLTGADSHVHYVVRGDKFTVVRPAETVSPHQAVTA